MFEEIKYIEVETDRNKRERTQLIDSLKKLVIQDVKDYCKKLNSGYSDFCYLDTMNKILKIELSYLII